MAEKNLVAEVMDLSRAAGIPDSVLYKHILGVTRSAVHTWLHQGFAPVRKQQLEELKSLLTVLLENKALPMEKEELLFHGLLHVAQTYTDK